MYIIENDKLSIEIAKKGAELRKIINKDNKENYMWKGDAEYWGRTASVLFPFIGGQNGKRYSYKGQEFKESKHGFARDYDFEVVEQKEGYIKFLLSSTDETLKLYPFNFKFYIIYTLEENKIFTKYVIENETDGEIYFSLGAHPAFATPVNEDIKFEDYYIEFEKAEEAESYLLDGVLLTREKVGVLSGDTLGLTENLFKNDAFVFEGINSSYVTLKNKINSNSVKVSFKNFPYLALWNSPGGEFVCIEPWYGINDFTDFYGDLSEKEGNQKLEKNQSFEAVLIFEIN